MSKQVFGIDALAILLPVIDRVGIAQHPRSPIDESFGVHGDES